MGKASFILAFVVTSYLCVTEVSTGKPLYVGGLFEMTDFWWTTYSHFFPRIFEYAFDLINNRTDILPDYDLKLVVKDTQGQNGFGAIRLMELIEESPAKVAIVGPSTSDQLTLVGQITPYHDIIQLSYVAETASTADTALFPTLFKVNPIADDMNPLRIDLMKYFGWSRVATIFGQEERFTTPFSNFHEMLSKNNMTLVTSSIITEGTNIRDLITRLKEYDVRIIIAAFRNMYAAPVFCEAYKQGLYGSSHVWIITGIYANWVREADYDAISCTQQELMKASDGHFTLEFVKLSIHDDRTISGMTPNEVHDILTKEINDTPYKLSFYFGYIFDTAWALALALNNSLLHLDESKFDNYTYSPYFLAAITSGMRDVMFSGISGPVAFDDKRGRMGLTFLEQSFNDTRANVAIHDRMTSNLSWLVDVATLWEDGRTPQDRFTYEESNAPASLTLVVIVLVMNTLGCILALGFLGFNIYYRQNRNVKLSSPIINNIIISGSLMMYATVYFATMRYGYLEFGAIEGQLCMVQIWSLTLGFTSLFGALFFRTWRIHVIFRDYKLKRKSIKDYHIVGCILVLWLIDGVLLVLWTSIHSLEERHVIKHSQSVFVDSNVIQLVVYHYCSNAYAAYWYAAMYVYKGLLLAFGVFLAWETRNVNIDALKDSKSIGLCIYNVVIVCIFGVPLNHVLSEEQTTLKFAMTSGLIIFCTTTCLCILFVPKIRLRNQVSGKFLVTTQHRSDYNDGLETTQNSHHVVPATRIKSPRRADSGETDMSCVDGQTLAEANEENARLRMQIANEAIAMAKLRKNIIETTGNIYFFKVGSDYVVRRTDDKKTPATDPGLEPCDGHTEVTGIYEC